MIMNMRVKDVIQYQNEYYPKYMIDHTIHTDIQRNIVKGVPT